MNTPPPPPAHVLPYVEIMGLDRAVEFLLEFGGSEMTFGDKASGRSMVAKRFGLDVAQGLSTAFHEGRIGRSIPIPKAWLARVLFARGLSVNEIARKLHASTVAVRRHVRPIRDARQGDLFEPSDNPTPERRSG